MSWRPLALYNCGDSRTMWYTFITMRHVMKNVLCYLSKAGGCLGCEDSSFARKPCQGMDHLRDWWSREGDVWTWKVCYCTEEKNWVNYFLKNHVHTHWDQRCIGCLPARNELNFFPKKSLSTMNDMVGHDNSGHRKCCWFVELLYFFRTPRTLSL